jgi:hypothetical protein
MAELISVEELNEQLQLKPSFKVEIDNIDILHQFSEHRKAKTLENIEIKLLDDHVWLSIPEVNKKYYSPRLHIEVEHQEKQCVLHCTFGPDPNLWTMFMFVHFFLALSFMGLLTWFYTNITLDHSNLIVYILMAFIALCWIGLYVFARQNREKAAPQSRLLLKALSRLIH